MTLVNVTIADNESRVLGSGLGGSLASSTTLINTLIVNNGGGGTNCSTDLTLVDGGGNLQYPGNSCLGRPTSGGPAGPLPTATQNPVAAVDAATVTYPLPVGSQAIDSAQDCPDTDELGTLRPQPGPTGEMRCDIGAIERVNRPPTARIDAPAGGYTVGEGIPIQLSGRGSDPDGDTLAFRWAPVDNLDNVNVASPTFTAVDEGQFPLTLTVSDAESSSTPATTTVTVTNVPPIVTVAGFTPANPIRRGTPVTVTASITDPGIADAVTCALEWDDGTAPTPAAASGSGTTRTCTASHLFGAAGTYTVTVRASDGDGGSGSATTLVVLYDPAAGPVSGDAQIDSPAGALRTAPGSTGRAPFSVSATYPRTTSTTPNGSVTWQLPTSGFRFSSRTLSWLVVSGTRFQIGGTGEVGGSGTYRFLLTGVDGRQPSGQGDLVRLRVWDPAAGNAVVYDSTLDPAATDDMDDARPIPLLTGNLTVR